MAAPGVGIVSTLPSYDNASGTVNYGYMSGTSMATPVVAGIAALAWGQTPATRTNIGVENRIFATAQPIVGTGSDWRYGEVDACRVAATSPAVCEPPPPPPPPPPRPAPPSAAPTEPPPSDIAAPAPIAPAPRPTAALGTYSGSLGRRGGPLTLVVSGRGDAVTRLRVTVLMRCQRIRTRRVRIVGLSTIKYVRIASNGGFKAGLRERGAVLRAQQIHVTGAFNPARLRAQGTLRVTGSAPATGRCDSGVIKWAAHLARSA